MEKVIQQSEFCPKSRFKKFKIITLKIILRIILIGIILNKK